MASSLGLKTLSNGASICRSCRLRLQRQSNQHTNIAGMATTHGRLPRLANQSGQVDDDLSLSRPRWERTPQAMRSPHRLRPKSVNDEYPCNEDPVKLNEAFKQMLGPGHQELLPEEIKWLAVTHKSFDHGRRGFNDRLAFMGKRILELQTSLALLNAPMPSAEARAATSVDTFGRAVFQHPSLANLESIKTITRDRILDMSRLAQLAKRHGIDGVIRWKPKQVDNLTGSGLDTVLAHTVYAIIGAVALQRGGQAANEAVRYRILSPLGLN